eukprot:TRINITY_DN12515_c0_g1_i1.p2 TRINITY_DN12515_c0_g1~~TRINITY_DN12515_c0_g1_i1.p2  ORF type:complete len:127 (+),score=13.41 TRINITY_DN12515_c0_g1_i1:73-453(+)
MCIRDSNYMRRKCSHNLADINNSTSFAYNDIDGSSSRSVRCIERLKREVFNCLKKYIALNSALKTRATIKHDIELLFKSFKRLRSNSKYFTKWKRITAKKHKLAEDLSSLYNIKPCLLYTSDAADE